MLPASLTNRHVTHRETVAFVINKVSNYSTIIAINLTLGAFKNIARFPRVHPSKSLLHSEPFRVAGVEIRAESRPNRPLSLTRA